MYAPRMKKASTSVDRAVGSRRDQRSGISSRPLQVLQRALGNKSFGVLQAKLTLGQPGDKYEQEADRVADAVMRMGERSVQRQGKSEAPEEEEELQAKPLAGQITPLVQRQGEPRDDEEEEVGPVQAKPLNDAQVQRKLGEEEEEEVLNPKSSRGQPSEVSSGLEARISSIRSGGGQPLDSSTRAFMEALFGYDFSGVRVHTGRRGAETARALNARAFTVRQDVVFGAGQYAPGTSEGRHLLAHELTHVVQNRQPQSDLRIRGKFLPPPGTEESYEDLKGNLDPLSLALPGWLVDTLTWPQAERLAGLLEGIGPEHGAYFNRVLLAERFSFEIPPHKLIRPVEGTSGSPFGPRHHPTLPGHPLMPHEGLDIVAPVSTPIKAATAGVVTMVDNGGLTPLGVYVEINHGTIGGINLRTKYCHMKEGSVQVKRLQVIGRGTTIGSVGLTGRTGGPHLHLEVRENGSPVDPKRYVE